MDIYHLVSSLLISPSFWAASALFLIGYTWATKTDGVDRVMAAHINTLQTEKLDRDGEIPATGPYVDVRAYASFVLAIDGIGATEKTLLIPNQQNVVIDKTVPVNVTLLFLKGGSLNISNTKTVTINGGIDAGLYQIFEGAGSVAWGTAGFVKEIYPQWWGAVADGSTDDTTAIQACFDSMVRGMRCFVPHGNYKMSTLTFAPGTDTLNGSECSLHCEGRFTSTLGAEAGNAFTIGTTSFRARRWNVSGLVLLTNKATAGDLVEADDWFSGRHGIRLLNVSDSMIDIKYVWGFEKAIYMNAPVGGGTYYDNIYPGFAYDCKYGIYIDDTGTNQSCNENCFYSGRATWDSGLFSGGAYTCYGIYTAEYSKANKFYGYSIENHDTNATIVFGDIYGDGSLFYGLRWEGPAVAGGNFTFHAAAGYNKIFYPWRNNTSCVVSDSGTDNSYFMHDEWTINIPANFADGIQTKEATTDVDDPPTDTNLDTAFGTPATVGDGFIGILNDNNADTDVWLCMTSNSKWWYIQLTEAVNP